MPSAAVQQRRPSLQRPASIASIATISSTITVVKPQFLAKGHFSHQLRSKYLNLREFPSKAPKRQMDAPIVNVEGPLIRETAESDWPFSCDLEVDFCSEKKVAMVYAALVVDKELQPDKVKRQMEISDCKLVVHFEAVEARFLRASFSAFVDVLTLATKVIEQFGPKEGV